ncbi:hypothetical protein M422DRAFT_50524 [Sphaerobolus stellatus SS14]|uniref:Up-regulated during septation protein 1 domain-containing protein n=1 Tax=Sphaerobolus stellatus (strain SS14) TaxID=990650 RepID=A0A0C9VJE7_SPHS4|nr:hypothetical protein M422DRAFT_50524 [Sphaerobolus stellatus SS14]
MNGVRRFFAATNVASSSSSSPPPPVPKDPTPEPGTSPPKPPSVAPLFISSGKQVFPRPKSRPASPDQVSSPTSPGTAPAALFARKDGPTSPRRKPVKVDVKSSVNGTRPSLDSYGNSPRSPTLPNGSSSKPYPNGTSNTYRPVEALKPQDSTWKQSSTLVNTRDELLMSLLASEAIVDSRGFEILSAEEVEELKREQQLLSSRLAATRKKLALETKIRDAAANLQKLQTVKRLSKQTSEQLDSANRKVELATKEVSQLLERTSEIDRKLLEHRSGVLSLSLRNLEAKQASANGEPNSDSMSTSRGLNSPASSVTSSTNRTKFDGAHLFAGHADSVIPGSLRKKVVDSAQVAALEKLKEAEENAQTQIVVLETKLKKAEEKAQMQVIALETKLKEAEEDAQNAQERAAILEAQLEQVQREKDEVEKNLDFDLQTAQETIMKMEREMSELELALGQHGDVEQERQEWELERRGWEQQQRDWEQEREEWYTERQAWNQQTEDWERRNQEWDLHRGELEVQRGGWDLQRGEWDQERRILQTDLESKQETISHLEQRLTDLQTEATKGTDLGEQLRAKDVEIERLFNNMQDDKQRWESRQILWQNEKRAEVERAREESVALATTAREELDSGLQVLYDVIRSHRIVASPTDSSLSGLALAISTHVGSQNLRLEQLELEKAELDVLRRKYEEDVRNGWEIRERLGREIEEARKEREDARKETRILEMELKGAHERTQSMSSTARSATPPILSHLNGKIPDDVNKIIAPLRALWALLPSVEARAQKLGKPSLGASSPSLADLDVRTLKSLYDPKSGFSSPIVSGKFDLDEFVARVQALIADDRALIERLLRFAQSHDLLRNNAERAQKLAQDSNKGLELYQAQVKTLEDRNATLTRKQLSMLDEIGSLQQSVDIITQEKRELEDHVDELSEKLQRLEGSGGKSNPDTGSGTAVVLRAEKTKLEAQVTDLRSQLDELHSEMDRIHESEALQQMALLDELNSLQQENGKLRDQLRAKK